MGEQEYISLFVKELNNELTATEQKALGSWMNADAEHKKIYAVFKKDWEKVAAYKSEITIDKEKAWQKISSKISAETVETKVISIANNKKWLRIAAALVIGLAMSFFVKDFILNGEFVVEQTAQDETKSIHLPDGSTVVLNENSSLKYKKSFAERNVSLEGEAFFEVTKDKTRPFSVKANNTTTQVLGTSFNIDAQEKEQVEVALLTGKVKFFNNTNNSVVLEPGEIAIYDRQTAIFSLSKNNNANSISWKTNKLVFDNTNLSTVVADLNDYYDTEITFDTTEANAACTFTGTFENEKVAEVLEVISFSLNAELIFTNNVYSIGSGDCQ